MASSASSKAAASSKKAVRVFFFIIAMAIIAGAVWISGTAVIENVRFARGTNQILQLVAMAHTLASRDKNFATQPNEDVIAGLARAEIMPSTIASDTRPMTITNPWKNPVRVVSPAPATMRIETDMPDQDCRRVALFFARNGADLGLTVIEARDSNSQSWQRFYASADGMTKPGIRAVEDACTQAQRVSLALVFTVR